MNRKKILQMILLLLSPAILFGLYVVGVLIYGSFHDWKPAEKIDIPFNPISTHTQKISDSTFTFMIWNVGYGGLGEAADFFYDGGNMVRSSKTEVNRYLEGIGETIQAAGADFMLLQEVDRHSKRSYYINEYEAFQKRTNNYFGGLALNFNVPFVPKKYFDPIGHVESGLATFSKNCPSHATRYQFPGEFSWPLRLFNLDRCFLASRYPLVNGKELIVINTHNSAYDDGSMKKQEMEYLKRFLLQEYSVGNYVIVGGDWNQCPPGFKWDTFLKKEITAEKPITITNDFMPNDWTWAYDPSIATNRSLTLKYEAESTFTTIIDFYLLSPNIELVTVHGKDLKFAYSDHQPIFLTCKLK